MNPEENEKKIPSKEEVKKMFEDNGLLPEGVQLKFGTTQNFNLLMNIGEFMFNVDYIDDPVFLYSCNAVSGVEEEEDEDAKEDMTVVSKIPMKLEGYALKNSKGVMIGFASFEIKDVAT